MCASTRAGHSRLSALAGVLVLASALSATRITSTAALTITPATHNFGQVVVGATFTIFEFTITLPPGGAAGDSVVATVTGPDASDFRVSRQQSIPLTTASRPFTTCATSAWRAGRCTVGVEFIPTVRGARNATLVVADTRGNRGTATLTGTGIAGCVMYEGLCNYAPNYSGTFGWMASIDIRQGDAAGPHRSGHQSSSVTITVVNGVASCEGLSFDSVATYTGNRLDEIKKSHGVIAGAGIIVVEFKQGETRPEYLITASCPSASITAIDTDYLSNTSGMSTSPAKPVTWSDRNSMNAEPARSTVMDLSGNQSFAHPDQDLDNGVSGTMSFTWSLKRN